MDGIDGIAGVQAVIAGIAWCVFGTLLSAPFVAFLGAIVAAGALGFLTLNWPPAKIFMGDAGSTVLGFIFVTVPLVAVVESRWAVRSARGVSTDALLLAAVLVVWPYFAEPTKGTALPGRRDVYDPTAVEKSGKHPEGASLTYINAWSLRAGVICK